MSLYLGLCHGVELFHAICLASTRRCSPAAELQPQAVSFPNPSRRLVLNGQYHVAGGEEAGRSLTFCRDRRSPARGAVT